MDNDEGIGRITVDRPGARNALTIPMRDALIDAMIGFGRDDSIRCILVAGAGDNFMAGGDVKNFAELARLPREERYDHFVKRIHTSQPLLVAMREMGKPIVCAVQGAAAGFGFSLAMACDLVIASEEARFACSYIGIGTSPDGSGSYYLPQLVGVRRAMEIALLGEFVDAPAAQALGLVNRVVPRERLEEESETIARRLASGPTVGLGRTKRLLYAAADNSLPAQLALEARSFAECAASDDWVEGVNAFIEKRKPRFRGC